MQLDNTTLSDLSIFQSEEEFSIFHKLNFTRTVEGREWLSRFFSSPFSEYEQIIETQNVVKLFLANLDKWPLIVSNGTIMVMAKFYESSIDPMPTTANLLNALNYRLVHSPDYSLVRYSIAHFADFLRGVKELLDLFDNNDSPPMLRRYLQRARELMRQPLAGELGDRRSGSNYSAIDTVYFGKFLRDNFRSETFELISIYGRLDAWYSMAVAMKQYELTFPNFLKDRTPLIDAEGLFHILLSSPIPYDVHMSKESNFIFLTGANMAGKSTFIRAVGSSVFMAHLGMGVPAKQMNLTIFDGMLSNINVVDNIVRGESYFFNEVQRIKNTIVKINDGKKWLVLIDELFKGTNVQDAMKCSSTVIKGLIKIRNSIFILSTHLYEIGEELKDYPNISFKYFETAVTQDQLEFSYQLKDGISNDRLGYLILKREKVVELLEKL